MRVDTAAFRVTIRPAEGADLAWEYVVSRRGFPAVYSERSFPSVEAAMRAGEEHGRRLESQHPPAKVDVSAGGTR